ncbi:TIR domain-containing protein [Agrobacterium arsenijevicii]|uniref:Thoeris protein ThsB TIR-like domain-containing protein n=1 Tax=Agrobacterium arsenijevicii TaxID=1585697 RepID=A0ABR5D314_9HYPH|nr:hypothetical protein RP75_21180 [Agrobacterium arsenijevicii]
MSVVIRRKIFVSYHHRGDQRYYDEFSRVFHDGFQLITDNSLERRIDSADVDYIMRRIRDEHLHGSSCTVVLCGAETPNRKYVDWEIMASLNQEMGIIGIGLPGIIGFPNGGTAKPGRLQDNIDAGYAEWIMWSELAANPWRLGEKLEAALRKNKLLLNNTRMRMTRNG